MPFYPNYFNSYYQPMTQPINQTPQQTTGIVWISSEREAAMYPVAPNNAVTLWNQNEPVVYLKQADASGKPTMITYDLIERSESPQNERNAQNDKLPTYATKEELATVVGAVKDIDGVITSLSKDVDELKKKKRRREEDDD